MTCSIFMTILGLSIAYTITSVDPLLFSLHLTDTSVDLGIPSDLVGFTGSASSLVVAAAVLGMGNLGDLYGLKRLLVYGFVGSIVIEVLSALSPNYQFLIAMRFLNGLALAALLGISLALLSVSVPDSIRPIAIGFYIGITGVFYGITPGIGGWVVEKFGWRAMFLIVVPLAVGGLLLTIKFVAEPERQGGRKLDIGGIALFGIALVGFIYGIGEVPNGFADPQTWVPLTIGIVAFVALLPWERHQEEPALDLSLFRQSAFVVAGLATVTYDLLMGGYAVVLGQFGTAVLGLSGAAVGLFYLPGTLLAAAACIVAGYVIPKFGARLVLICGLLVIASSSTVMATSASPTMALWVLVLATFLNTLGANITSTSASDVIVSHAPPERAGAVTAMKPALSKIGYSLGPTIYVLLLQVFFNRDWLSEAGQRGLTDEQARQAFYVAKNASVGNDPSIAPYDPDLVQQVVGIARVDYTSALRITMAIVTLLPLAVAALAHFTIRHGDQRASPTSPVGDGD